MIVKHWRLVSVVLLITASLFLMRGESAAGTKHNITLTSGLIGGMVWADKMAAEEGELVNIKAAPAAGYVMDWVWVEVQNEACSFACGNQNMIVEMPDNPITIKASFLKDAFKKGDIFPAFSSTTLDGKPITNAIFSEKKLTMVKVWGKGTYCFLNIEDEIADLSLLEDSMPENTQLVGIFMAGYAPLKPLGEQKASDLWVSEDIAYAKQLVTDYHVNFDQILYCDELYGLFSAKGGAKPLTYFVDSYGRLLDDGEIGIGRCEDYLDSINKILYPNADETPSAGETPNTDETGGNGTNDDDSSSGCSSGLGWYGILVSVGAFALKMRGHSAPRRN